MDLSESNGRGIQVNHDGRGAGLGIEGSAFTVESWINLQPNNNNNFNFFRFRNGDARVSLHYRGDQHRTDGPWKIEVKGIGVGETSWTLAYNRNGSSGPDLMQSWHHIAFSSNGSGGVRLYIDGTLLFAWTLTTDDGAISSLFPVSKDGDNNCYIGTASYNNGTEGKFYASEIRIWKTQLTDGEVSKYYDEEVNSSHPEWNNLVRYYHGQQSSGSGASRTFTDVSPVDTYHAAVTNSDVTVATGNTPTIKPPSFNNSKINASISATPCNTDDGIDVSWTDFQSTSNYTTYLTPGYEVTRVRDGKSVYTGNASSVARTEDRDVSAGDTESYQLRAFWRINNVVVYSDDVITSGTGSMSEVYAAPTGVAATSNNCDVTIDLTWDAMSPSPPKWTVQRATNLAFTSGVTTLSNSINGTVTNYTDTSPNAEQTYYYRVLASGTGSNGCTVQASPSVVVSGYSSQAPTAPTNLTVVVDDANNELDISWTNPNNSLADGFILRREKEDGSDPVEFVLNSNTTTYSDSDIEICQTYRYKIAATNECSPNGVFSNSTQTGLLGLDIDDVIESVDASKGYFSDAVLIEWEIRGSLSQVDRFRIERTVAGQDNYQLIGVVDNNLFFTDESASSGVFYNYRITGETTCNDEIVYTNEVVDLGFRQPFGITNGHVEYTGGNAVKDVTINFERQDGQAIGNSIKFDGNADYVAIDTFYYEGTGYKALTVETWFKTSSSGDQILASFDASEYWRLEINGSHASAGKIGFGIMGSTVSMESSQRVDDGDWHHVAVVFDNGQAYMYVDGERDDEMTANTTEFGSGAKRYGFLGVGSEATTFNGTPSPTDYFDGNLDEFRIWSVARSKEEIAENYNRLISNEQSGLEVYYRFDEGIGTQVYDASKTGDNFNRRDGDFVGGVTFSSEIPDADQLGIRAITDQFGDYTADYIPYNGSGDVFRVTPSFGQHVFTPSSRSIFLGDGSSVQNNVDFEDISFFTVSGKVTYKDTNVPVENVTILIDGEVALGADNSVVRTDAEGDYEINVPIGNHYLSVEKEGHTFYEGYFPPLDDQNAVTFHEFTEDLTVNFTDSTTVKLAGRLVGGTREAEKTIGFGLSTNNIGTATLSFDLQNGAYGLTTASVVTDEYSGEYEIHLIPEQFIISGITTSAGYTIDASELSVLDLRNSLDEITVLEDAEDTTSAKYSYHHQLNFVFRENPVILVYDEHDQDFTGDDVFTYTDQSTGDQVEIDLSAAGFPFPIFEMGSRYEANVYVVETYRNPGHPDGAIVDNVPVEGADVTIVDNLAIDPTDGNTGKTDANGYFGYDFTAGIPSITTDDNGTSFTKTFEVSATVDGIGVDWNNGEVFRAYVLGTKPQEGTGFVTYGPDQVDFVLRDPPGSNSYAYIEKGSSYSTTEGWGLSSNTNTGLDRFVSTGLDVTVGGGAVGPVAETDNVNVSQLGMTLTRSYDYSGNYTETYTFNERIETSSDPEDVGSMADLYVGKATNVYVSKTNNIRLVDKDYAVSNLPAEDYLDFGAEVVIAKLEGFAVDNNGTPTYFIYSQKFIIEELIPELLTLRDDLLRNRPGKYESHLDYASPYYGLNNDHPNLLDAEAEILAAYPGATSSNLSYTFTPTGEEEDSVAFVNDQITSWINQIGLNEAEKVEAKVLTNLSIDGGAGAYTSEVTQSYNSNYNYASARTMKFRWNSGIGTYVNGVGTEFISTFDAGSSVEQRETEDINHSVTFGYVIDEKDEGDYYSIDVKTVDGVGLYNRNKFADKLPSLKEFAKENAVELGVTGASLIKTGVTGGVALVNAVNKYILKNSSKLNGFSATASFAIDAVLFLAETADFTYEAVQTYQLVDGVDEDYNISAFKISSPIFSVKGGAARCPYEPGEFTFAYSDDFENPYELHTATLLRENPTINVETAIQNNVPEDEAAVFTLQLGNESETETNIWYELSIDETTNPDGAIILIDELTAERQYLVEANSILQKTLTIEKGASGVLNYDSIGLILHSVCQFDPEVTQAEIADTVYVSARFLPECSDVAVGNFNENWIINYADGEQIPVTLDDYNINLPTLEKIDFQYKTLSGTPATVMTYYKDASTDGYAEDDGPKGTIDGAADVSFIWDISSLNDGAYQIRARAHCSDGSVFESDYLTGTLDTSNPVAFGTPAPEDGILDAGDDIQVRLSEEIEAGFVKDFNIKVRSVLNGADVSHATSVQFDGTNDEVTIDNVTFNNKSFTVEYWLKNDVESTTQEAQVLTYANGNNLVEVSQLGTGLFFKLGANTLSVDPTGAYTDVNPWDSWHHWAFVYNAVEEEAKVYLDDQLILLESDVAYNPSFQGILTVGNGQLAGKMHELRIWEDVRSFGEIVSNMSITLSGDEPGLYGYWMMDEGTGEQSLDHASGRHATVDADWSLEPGGVSWAFDGSNYLTINSTNILADAETDFTIEFWFKGTGNGATQTLMSNGKGDGTDPVTDPNSVVTIEARADGTIHVLSNGYDFQGTSTDVMDGDWHHLAFVVDRSANARMYIDGQQQEQTNAQNISDFYGAELTLGARIFNSGITDLANGIVPITYDNNFSGSIDEVRFWNTARPARLIDQYMNTKIERDEPGLISYHPFETYEVVLGAYLMEYTLVDQVENDDLSDVSDAVASDAVEHFSDDKPPVKDVRGIQDIPFDFAVNDDEIVILPTVDADRIEGQVLEITLLSVQDLNGNKLLSPITWTAFVQQNQVKWDASDISVTKSLEEELTLQASFTNSSGSAYTYNLENIPAWLSPSLTSGVINPLETIEVELEVNDALNIGSYNHSITLSSGMGFDDQLAIDLRVFGDEPEWSVDDSDFEYSMSIFGRLIVNGEVSMDEYDQVAAFVGDELRGVASPTYVAGVDEHQVFLTIYSNEVANEDIDFKVYDASTGNVHENVTPDFTFIANDIQGTILNPIEIEADDRISLEISLNEGWTWISFNLDDASLSAVNSTLMGIGSEGDIVKNQSSFDEYSMGMWFGTLTGGGGFTPGDMYKIRLSSAATLRVTGSPTDVYTTPINIGAGWNHLGFVPQDQMTLQEALISMNPTTGDVLKTSGQFAMYAGAALGWVGSLKAMRPGEGYMLYANSPATLTYPERASLTSARTKDNKTYDDLFTITDNDGGHTMSVVATVEGLGDLINQEDQLLVALVEGEVRGYVQHSRVADEQLFFISLSAEEEDQVQFKLYDALNASFTDLIGNVDYSADQILGSFDRPFALRLGKVLSIGAEELIQVYPNPFTQLLNVVIPGAVSAVNVTLLDVSGKVLFSHDVENARNTKTVLRLEEEVAQLKGGVYLLQITNGQEKRIIKLKK